MREWYGVVIDWCSSGKVVRPNRYVIAVDIVAFLLSMFVMTVF
jgi:hypothetical protein